MEIIILIICFSAFFLFGLYIMQKVDAFLMEINRARQNHGKKERPGSGNEGRDMIE